LISGTIQ